MTDLEVHLPVAAQPTVETTLDLIERVERLGYRRVWAPETWGRDAVSTLAVASRSVDTIGLGTSVLNVYSRSPAVLAQTATTLAELAPADVRLGLGASGPAVIERWHGLEYDRPLRRTREAVEIIRAILSGEVVNYEGDIFTLEGFRLRCDPPADPIPIDLGGLGPKSVELAGFVADGWHALLVTPDGLRQRLDDLEVGATKAGRSPDDIRITLSVPCCALEDGTEATRLVAEHIAFYVGAMGPYYAKALGRQGYEATARAVVDAWQSGERYAATDAIGDELLDDLGVAGSPEAARAALDRLMELQTVDAVAVSFPRGASPAQVDATVDALAPGTGGDA